MAVDERRSCATCVHSLPNVTDDDELTLICRRYPPPIIVIDDEPTMCWPQTDAAWLCGEHDDGSREPPRARWIAAWRERYRGRTT